MMTKRWCRILATYGLLVGPAVGAAQTVAPEEISGVVVWTAQASPYLVNADLHVLPGAQLRIDPGVRVELATDANISIEGQLVAEGLSGEPVVFTAQSPQSAQEWGNLLISGTVAASVLRHVEVSYGKGVIVQGSSPHFWALALNHNAGPAITIDLASSPVGGGLSANDNEINGILVAGGGSGRISGDVVWALRGIPYVVQGMIDVGGQTFAFEPDHLTLAIGTTVELELNLPEPAAVAVEVPVESMAPTLVAVQPSVLQFAPAQDRASVTIEGLAESVEPVAVFAYRDGVASAPALVRVLDVEGLSLLPTLPEVVVGGSVSMLVRAPEPAPPGGLTVNLSVASGCASCIAAVTSVAIPAGAFEATFELNGLQPGSLQLRAQTPNLLPAQVAVSVRQPFVRLPTSFIVAPGTSRTMQVELSNTASVATQVNVELQGPALASFPATVTIPAGQRTASVTILAGSDQGETQLLASADGFESSTTHLWVKNLALALDAGDSIPLGFSDDVKVVLSGGVAPPGGLLVEISSAPAGLVQVIGSSLVIPAGQTRSVPIRIKGLVQGTASLATSAGGVESGQHDVQVVGPMRARFNRAATAVGVGLQSSVNELDLTLVSGPAGAEVVFHPRRPVGIRVVNAHTSQVLSTPAVVSKGPGAGPGTVRLEGVAPTASQQPVQLFADIEGYDDIPAVLDVDVVTPGLSFVGLELRRTPGAPRDGFQLRWEVPGASFAQAPTSVVWIPVAIQDPDPVGIVGGIYTTSTSDAGDVLLTQLGFNPGWFQSTVGWIGSPVATGSYRVRAGSEAAPIAVSDTVQVGLRTVRLVPAPSANGNASLSPGMNYPCGLWAIRELAGQPFSPPQPVNLQVDLSSSHPAVVLPASVVITSTNYMACVPVQVTDSVTEPVVLSAQTTDTNYMSAPPLDVAIVSPALRFYGPAEVRELGSMSEEFAVGLCTGPVSLNDCQRGYPTQDAEITLEIIEPAPQNVIASITSSVEIPTHSSMSSSAEIGLAQAVGQYRIRAHLPAHLGGQPFASDLLRVATARFELQWSDKSNAAQPRRFGRGMRGHGVLIRKTLEGQHDPCWWNTGSPVQLELTTSDQTKVRVDPWWNNESPRGSCFEPVFEPEAIGLTEPGVPVLINVQTDNHVSGPPLAIEVVEPELRFADLSYSRPLGDGPDEFSVGWWIEEGGQDLLVGPFSDQVVGVELDDPGGVVPGIYSDPDNPDLGNEMVLWMHADGGSTPGYVASPSTSGLYRLTASVEGFDPAEAEVEVIARSPAPVAPALQLSPRRSTVHVGAGLVAHPEELVFELRGTRGVVVAPQDTEVRLRCAAAQVCSVASPLVLRAGESRLAVALTGQQPGSTALILDSDHLSLEATVEVQVHLPELRLKAIDPLARTPSGEPVGFRVYAYVLKAQRPVQAPAQDWRVEVRAESSGARLSSDHALLRSGALESDVVWLTGRAAAAVRVHASRAGSRSGAGVFVTGGQP